MEGEGFLKNKFQNLHTSPEVVSAAKRTEKRTEEKVSQKPVDTIENYLDRFQEVLDREDPQKKERGVEAFKKILFKDNIISEENIPERVYKLEQEIAFNQGHGHIEITEEYKNRKNSEIVSGQERSLSAWIDYLSSNDAMYPMWAKYWVMQSVLKVGKYNKEKKAFDKRGKNSVAPFPPVNAGAIAKAIAVIQEKIKGGEIESFSNLNEDEFQKVLNKEDFAKIYALALESLPEFSEDGLENIEGEWKVYKQGSDPKELFDSLQGYPLEWCTAQNIDTAKTQLEGGDFHVYYSEDSHGNNKIPRVAIRMENNNIAEVRGIEPNQEMDKHIMPVVEEKMDRFGGDGKRYKKRVFDMRRLTDMYNRSFEQAQSSDNETRYLDPDLQLNDLLFLYEVHDRIEGFGYNDNDPRIAEIIRNRDIKKDLGVIFEYADQQNELEEYDRWDKKGAEDLLHEKNHVGYNQLANYVEKDDKEYQGAYLEKQRILTGILERIPANRWVEIQEFFEPSPQLIDSLIASGGVDYVVENWQQVGTGDIADLLKVLLDSENENKVFENTKLLSSLVTRMGLTKLINTFTERGKGYYIILKLELIAKPSEYYSVIEQTMSSSDHVGDPACETIVNIDNSIVNESDKLHLLLAGKRGNYVFRSWDVFRSLDQNVLAKTLIEHGIGFDVVRNIEKFDYLENAIVQLLFTDLVVNKRYDYNNFIDHYLQNIKGTDYLLDTETAQILTDGLNRYGLRHIAKNLDCFNNPNMVRNLLEEETAE